MSNFSVGNTSVGGDTWHNGCGRPVLYYGGDGRNYYIKILILSLILGAMEVMVL